MKPYTPISNRGRTAGGADIHHRTADQPKRAANAAAKPRSMQLGSRRASRRPRSEYRETPMSCEAYRLTLMQRALARSDAELFGNRQRYLDVAKRLAQRLLSTD